MSRRLGGPRAHRKSMIVQTSPILGGGARCQSPLGPPGVSASSDVSRQLASPLDSPKVSGAGFVWTGPGSAGGQPGQGVGSRYRSAANQSSG